MTDPAIAALAAGLTAGEQLAHDLTDNWDAFCDADPLPFRGQGEYPDRIEQQGYAELVPVDADALDDSFAWERGINPGGMMWQLTATGLQLRAHLAALKEQADG